jgi:hypothetical protein
MNAVHYSRTGLGLFGLLSVGDIAALALTDGSTPPYAVAAVDTALGLVSLYLVIRAWRGGPVRALIALRVVSALTAAPAFVVTDVPVAARAAAAGLVALTALAVVLVARRPELEPVR